MEAAPKCLDYADSDLNASPHPHNEVHVGPTETAECDF